jgi:hypothetical protein
MAKTYANLMTEAREILQDTNTDPTLQRYTDQTLLDQLNRGLQELYRIRPDAYYDLWDDTAEDFLVPSLTLAALPDPASYQNNFVLPMMFYAPLMSYIIGMVEAIDDEFTDDSRAMTFLSEFKRMVNGL